MIFLSEFQNIRPTFKNDYSFGNGLKIIKMNKVMKKISDQSIKYYLRFFKDRWALFYEEPTSSSLYIDGDPSGAVRFIVDTLLLSAGPSVRLGPKIGFKYKPKGKYKIDFYCYTGIHLDKPWPHGQIKLTLYKTNKLKKLFYNLINNYKIDLINIPLSFYRRACEAKGIPYEALLFGTIGLESIFLNNDKNKAKLLAQRSAVFLNNKKGANPSIIYRDIFSVYKIRNAIIHEGLSHPKIKISYNSNSWKLDCIKARDLCLDYLRKVLIDIINNPQNKNSLLTNLKNSQNFPDYKTQII